MKGRGASPQKPQTSCLQRHRDRPSAGRFRVFFLSLSICESPPQHLFLSSPFGENHGDLLGNGHVTPHRPLREIAHLWTCAEVPREASPRPGDSAVRVRVRVWDPQADAGHTRPQGPAPRTATQRSARNQSAASEPLGQAAAPDMSNSCNTNDSLRGRVRAEPTAPWQVP